MLLGKCVLKICSRFAGEHPCRSVISMNLQSNFIEITLRHGCSPVDLLHIFRTFFSEEHLCRAASIMLQIADLFSYCCHTFEGIEKVVHEQTTKFLNDNNIFCKYRSDFRNNHSTDLFLSFLNDKILKGFDKGLHTGMILIDLLKTYTINHKILLDKHFPIDFLKNTISSFESYLAERHFTVEVANWVSKFLISVDDMSKAVESKCLLFQIKGDTEIKNSKPKTLVMSMSGL